jgi:hypothetical protein
MSTLSLNVGNFIILKLIPTNYPLWREQALALAEIQDLVDHLINKDSIPNKYIIPDSTTTTNSSPKLTEEYIVWRKANRLLHGWLIGTISEQTRPCSRPRYNLYCLKCSKKWICKRLPRTRIHLQTKSHLFSQRRWQNHWRTHSNLQRTMRWPYSYWETNFRQRKNLLPPHKSRPSIWNIHYHNVETTKTFLPGVGLSIAEPRPKKKLVYQLDK